MAKEIRNWDKAKETLTKEEMEYILKFEKGYFHLTGGDFESYNEKTKQWRDLIARLSDVGIKGRRHKGYGIYIYTVPKYFYEI